MGWQHRSNDWYVRPYICPFGQARHVLQFELPAAWIGRYPQPASQSEREAFEIVLIVSKKSLYAVNQSKSEIQWPFEFQLPNDTVHITTGFFWIWIFPNHKRNTFFKICKSQFWTKAICDRFEEWLGSQRKCCTLPVFRAQQSWHWLALSIALQPINQSTHLSNRFTMCPLQHMEALAPTTIMVCMVQPKLRQHFKSWTNGNIWILNIPPMVRGKRL